jgi:iduronate 2-sulfatase
MARGLVFALLLSLTFFTPWTAHASQDGKRWNVLFIMADDLRVELGCYGSIARTPNIDALARRGVRFTRAYCQQALCNPSRSSMLTGRRPDSLHVWANSTHFRERNPDVVTLPQWFKQHGYETRCVGKIFHNWHTQEKGDRRSWSADEFLHYANHGDDEPRVVGPLPQNFAQGIGRNYGKVPVTECRDVPDEAYYDGRVAAEAQRVLREIRDRPFFLAVGFWKPHAPFNAPKKYWDLYERAQLPAWDGSRPEGAPEVAFHDNREILGIPPNQVTITREQAGEMRHGYFAAVSFLDTQVGKLLATLDELGLSSNTIIVFVSDHGYHLGEHGLWAKTSCFEWDAQVPLIISVPAGAASGAAATGLVELVDLFPTLIELCGLPTPQGLEGTSLVPMLQDPNRELKEAAYTQHPRPNYYDRTPSGVPEVMGYSVRTRQGRYTEWRRWDSGEVVAVEYYDHRTDPHETHNQAATTSSAMEQARSLLHRMFPSAVPPSAR